MYKACYAVNGSGQRAFEVVHLFPHIFDKTKQEKHLVLFMHLDYYYFFLLCTVQSAFGLVVWTAGSHGFLPARSHGNLYWKTGNAALWCLAYLACLSKDARGLIYNALMDRATGKPPSSCGSIIRALAFIMAI